MTTGQDEKARLWDAQTGRHCLVNYADIENRFKRRVDFALSTTSARTLLLHPQHNHIGMYDVLSGQKLRVLRGHFSQVLCAAYHPHREEMFSGSNDREILVWLPDLGRFGVSSLEPAVERAREGAAAELAAAEAALDADNWSDSDEDDV